MDDDKSNEENAENEEDQVEIEVVQEDDEVKLEPKLSVAESVANKLKERPSMMSRASMISRIRRRREARERCQGEMLETWDCENTPLWRIYMQVYAAEVDRRAREREQTYGKYYKPKCMNFPRIPGTCFSRTPICHKLNVFNAAPPCSLPVTPSARLWQHMRSSFHNDGLSVTDSWTSDSDNEWPKLYPCSSKDAVREAKILARKEKLKLMGALPCKIDEVVSPESSEDEEMVELAALKEVGHAVVPLASALPPVPLIDRDTGIRTGLVEGDWAFHDLASKSDNRRIACMTLRGSTGMRPAELDHVRVHTWKFCLHQAIVALLAKTQLRYKWAWSATLDHLYERGWLVFLHVGHLNVSTLQRPSQRFDDVLVYNYKYSIELELLCELDNITVHPQPDVKFTERSSLGQRIRPTREITLAKADFGAECKHDDYRLPAHRSVLELEMWLDHLEPHFTSCIYRTTRFALAFWQDGPFWYLYNPYRCDEFGFWDESGACCIVKFCSRTALKRHLMILTIRAYARGTTEMKNDWKCVKYEMETFNVQIYRILYHECRIHNVKLYNRKPRKPRTPLVEKKPSDPCTFDPLAHLAPRICEEYPKDESDQTSEKIEKSSWVNDLTITWSKVPQSKANDDCNADISKKEPQKWHLFDVIEPRRLYVLWGDLHIGECIFVEENRSRQFGACYAVCAAMTLIKAPEYWTPKVLDAIIVCGDSFFTQRMQHLGRKPSSPVPPEDEDGWEARPKDKLRVGEMHFEIEARSAIRGRLFARGLCLWQALEQLFYGNSTLGVLSCENTRLGVFRHCGAYYIHDVRSRGPPIYNAGAGGSYLLRTSCISDMLRCIILLVGSPECSDFEIRPLEIVKAEEKTPICEPRKAESKCAVVKNGPEPACPGEDEKKKASKKKSRKRPVIGNVIGRPATCGKKTCH